MISGKTLDLWSQQYFISKYVDFEILYFHSCEDLMRFVLSTLHVIILFLVEWLVPHCTPFCDNQHCVLLHGIYVLFFYFLAELHIKQLLAMILCETSNFFSFAVEEFGLVNIKTWRISCFKLLNCSLVFIKF